MPVRQERSAGFIVYVEPDAEHKDRLYLVLDYGKHWDYAKGHVEKGEDDLAAALRELDEETGIDDAEPLTGFSYELDYLFRHPKRGLVKKTVIFFIAKARDVHVEVSDEHVGYAWLPLDQALERVTFPNARKALEAAATFLGEDVPVTAEEAAEVEGEVTVQRVLISMILLLIAGCATPPKAESPAPGPADPVDYGPTFMKKVDGGYELANRKLRVVISERAGDVTYFGLAGAQKNFLGDGGITLHLANQRNAAPDGYVEKRDDETWQYLGDSLTGIRWRKIYCLHHDVVAVTALIENRTRDSIDTAIAVRAVFANGEAVIRQPDLHERRLGGLTVRLQVFNEGKPEKPDWATLIGDFRTLKPEERIGITMEWKVSGL